MCAAFAAAPDSDTLFKALNDELQRSMTLRLEGLDSPYFIQYAVDDTVIERIAASYGALTRAEPSRSRDLHTLVRVGSYDLDNSNFTGGRGGFGRRGSSDLPLDDDYLALRQAIWKATDSHYKSAVETLTQKRAYLKDRTIEDRPDDFTKTTVVTSIQEHASLSFDRKVWEDYVRRVSAKFAEHRHIQTSDVRFTAGVENRYLLNSEGSRLRCGYSEVLLRITAEAQAGDGERLSDQLVYFAPTPAQLPSIEKILADVQALADRLAQSLRAPVLKDYTGPVLIDEAAAPQLFRQLLARGIAGQIEPVGSQRRNNAPGTDDLEKRLGKRVLPTSFHVYDDPRNAAFQGTPLAGYYLFDDEGVRAQRVEIVTNGKLQGMVMSRTPTKRFSQSTGHGRRGSSEPPRSTIGCLYIESSDTKNPDELKKALLKAADDEGLDYGLRIAGLRSRDPGDGPALRFTRGAAPNRGVGDPVAVYKVYVADGREELVRGCEFRSLDERNLRRILAAGNVLFVDNNAVSSTPSSSVIAPAVLLEEMELTRIDRESEKKPIIEAPQARAASRK
jgi:hypothetical protein